MTAVVMEAVLTHVSTFFSQSISWMRDLLVIIGENPLLFIFIVCLPLTGFVIGLIKRMFSV